jgi:hypothetical protein
MKTSRPLTLEYAEEPFGERVVSAQLPTALMLQIRLWPPRKRCYSSLVN